MDTQYMHNRMPKKLIDSKIFSCLEYERNGYIFKRIKIVIKLHEQNLCFRGGLFSYSTNRTNQKNDKKYVELKIQHII